MLLFDWIFLIGFSFSVWFGDFIFIFFVVCHSSVPLFLGLAGFLIIYSLEIVCYLIAIRDFDDSLINGLFMQIESV